MAESLPRSRSYEGIAADYEQARGGVRRAQELVEPIAGWLEPGSLVLDVGAGTAIVADELRRAGHTMIPLDMSPSMLRQAAARFPGQVVLADGQALPVRAGAVDVVLFVWSLHHVGDPVLALGEGRRVLRPGGRIVVVSGQRDPGDDDMQPLFSRLEPLRSAGGAGADVIAADAACAGLRLCDRRSTAGTFDQSPQELAAQIEQRLFAPLWDLSDEDWNDRVQPVVDGLLALPEPGVRRRCQSCHPVLLFQPR